MKKNIKYYASTSKKILSFSIAMLFMVGYGLSEAHAIKMTSDLKEIEIEHHKSCVLQGSKFGKWSDVSTEFYWECRHNLMQAKIIPNANSTSGIQNNMMVNEIDGKIIANLQRARRATLSGIESDIELFDHSKCLAMGHDLDTNDQGKNEEYYKCREKLIDDRSPAPPGITDSYYNPISRKDFGDKSVYNVKSNKPTSGEVEFVMNKINEYPNCKNINVKSIFFNKCIDSQKKAFFCFDGIRALKAKKQLNDKIYCQQQSFIQFPDGQTVTRNKSAEQIEEMLKKERERKIDELKMAKERDINRTKKFFEEGYVSQDKVLSREADINNLKAERNKRENLFNKVQILELRQEFIEKCNQSLGDDMPQYVAKEEKKCADLSNSWNQLEGE